MSKAYLLGVMHDSTERKTTYRITSKEQYFVEFSKKLVQNTQIISKKDKIEYIRGYFDAEGSVPKSRDSRFYIYFSQKNKKDLEELKSYIESLGIICGKTHNPSIKKDPEYWRFYISCKPYDSFIELIGSWHPTKSQHLRVKI